MADKSIIISIIIGIVAGLLINFGALNFYNQYIQIIKNHEIFSVVEEPVISALRLKKVMNWDDHTWIKMEALKERDCGTPLEINLTYYDDDADTFDNAKELTFFRNKEIREYPKAITVNKDIWQDLSWWRILPVLTDTKFMVFITHSCKTTNNGVKNYQQANQVITKSYGPFVINSDNIIHEDPFK